MNRPGFTSGACIAALLALLASIGATVLAPLLTLALLCKLLVAILGLAYILYLLSRASQRTGRVTALALWLAMALFAWLVVPSITLYVCLHVGAIWLLRSLYYHGSVFSALLDLGVNALAIATAYWAAMHTASVFLAVWCFFLVQALFAVIPPTLDTRAHCTFETLPDTGNFERARRRADAAIRQLLAQ